MLKSPAFFFISSFNSDPYELVNYCTDYEIVDQSDDPSLVEILRGRQDSRLRFVNNTGTSLINYLDFIIERYERLPPLIAFLKSNVIGRHIEKDRFEKLIGNSHYTYLWHDEHAKESRGTTILPQPNRYLELNNSWYVGQSRHRYFLSYNDMMRFLFEDFKAPSYVDFCPGACFIVEKSRILAQPKGLYVALREFLLYDFFPSEAWMVERALGPIFTGDLTAKPFVRDEKLVVSRIESLVDLSDVYVPPPGPLATVRKLVNFVSKQK